MTRVIFIVGPTGVGKTALSLELAARLDGEIVSMDSMQIYRGMDIGTAKATPQERSLVAHHLLDIVDPDESFSVGAYQQAAYSSIDDIAYRGKTPIVVGGTGLYLDALFYDFNFANVGASPEIRSRLEAEYAVDGGQALLRRLSEIDPATRERLSSADAKKIVRALEIYETTGQPLSRTKTQNTVTERFEPQVYVLSMAREMLYAQIDRRVEHMIDAGLFEEVRGLLASGVSLKAQALSAIGYREVIHYLRGLLSKAECVALIQKNSRNYAKRQLTWYRKERSHRWLDRGRMDQSEMADLIVSAYRGKANDRKI